MDYACARYRRASAQWLVETLRAICGSSGRGDHPGGARRGGCGDSRMARWPFAPPDYEWAHSRRRALAGYRAQRDPFALTGSPALPAGLNLGAQLHWLDRIRIRARRLARAQLCCPMRNTGHGCCRGVARSEVTSLGCHSDLWAPADARFLADGEAARLGGAVRAAGPGGRRHRHAAPGTCRADRPVARRPHPCRACTIPTLPCSPRAAFPRSPGGRRRCCPPAPGSSRMRTPAPAGGSGRTCPKRATAWSMSMPLAEPVPSARFMGGREIETLIEIDTRGSISSRTSRAARGGLRRDRSGAMLLPELRARAAGPFPHGQRPLDQPPRRLRTRAAPLPCLYAALVADASLDLIGAKRDAAGRRPLCRGRSVRPRAASLAARHAGLHRQRAQRRLVRRAAADRSAHCDPRATLRRVEPLDSRPCHLPRPLARI